MAENFTCDSDTFADSEGFGGIYCYSYVLIALVIIAGGYQFASKVKLYFESYQLLETIEQELGIITLSINALHVKYGKSKDDDTSYVEYSVEQKLNVKMIDKAMVNDKIDDEFNKMFQLLENHKQFLKKKIDIITQETDIPEQKDKHDSEFKLTKDEIQMGVILSDTKPIKDGKENVNETVNLIVDATEDFNQSYVK